MKILNSNALALWALLSYNGKALALWALLSYNGIALALWALLSYNDKANNVIRCFLWCLFQKYLRQNKCLLSKSYAVINKLQTCYTILTRPRSRSQSTRPRPRPDFSGLETTRGLNINLYMFIINSLILLFLVLLCMI